MFSSVLYSNIFIQYRSGLNHYDFQSVYGSLMPRLGDDRVGETGSL